MNVKLTIPERLKDLRVNDRQLTLEQLAEQTGLSKSALGQYEADDYKEISITAVTTLATFYDVSTDYLLGISENKKRPDAEIESLHLSDEMIELLRSDRINNRLLCELAAHSAFPRLMADIEIIIDHIASMEIDVMNLKLEALRQDIISRHAPDKDDLYLRTLKLGQIQQSEYFNHVIHDDMDSIVSDLKQRHREDAATADEQPKLEQFKKQYMDAINNESQEEGILHHFCDTMQIPYEKVSLEEIKGFMKLVGKSPLMKLPGSMRGKAKSGIRCRAKRRT